MKKALFALLLNSVGFWAFSQGNWEIDNAKSKITFVISGPFGTKVNGSLSPPKGDILFDPSHLENSSFSITIDAQSVNTDNTKRDEHLKKAEFFDVIKYKTITFSSAKIERSSKGFIANGILKIKDRAKPVKIEFSFAKNGNTGTWKGELTINRLDFTVGNSSFLVGDEAKIAIELVALSK